MLDIFAIFGAKYLFLASFLIAVICALTLSKEQQKKLFYFGLLALPFIYCIAVVAGYFYVNPRPFVVENFIPLIPNDASNGFPSDHTLLVAAIAAVFTFFHKRVALALWTITLLVGAARVYAGVHHVIDVLASMLIAIVGAFVVAWLLDFIEKRSVR